MTCFNPRSRMGSDFCARVCIQAPGLFQPTLPHGERLDECNMKSPLVWFQPTLPHGERHVNGFNSQQAVEVSTHAPAWGATDLLNANKENVEVSTHAPAWGATRLIEPWEVLGEFQPTLPHGERHRAICFFSISDKFQPTLPHGERLRQPGCLPCRRKVSTHAPAWGATRLWTYGRSLPYGFNPRSRMGSDRG